jgi:hypothetical protein
VTTGFGAPWAFFLATFALCGFASSARTVFTVLTLRTPLALGFLGLAGLAVGLTWGTASVSTGASPLSWGVDTFESRPLVSPSTPLQNWACLR